MGLAGQTGPGDQAGQAGQAGQTGTAGQAGRRGGGEIPLPKRVTGQAGAGRPAAPTDPAEAGPAHDSSIARTVSAGGRSTSARQPR